jgi:hypothetical protein
MLEDNCKQACVIPDLLLLSLYLRPNGYSISNISSDYHMKKNMETFMEWFLNKFIQYLKSKSFTVMGNASYHSTTLYKVSSTQIMNSETAIWLCSENIHHSSIQKWAELLELVKEKKKTWQKIYELNTTIQEQGHQVLRLSPYHCQYNPAWLTRIQMKGYITEKNTFKIAHIMKQTYETTCHITILAWEKCRDFIKGSSVMKSWNQSSPMQ